VSARATSAWLVPLDGHAFDLEDLPVYLQGSPVDVVSSPGGYQLRLPVGLTGPSHDRVRQLAADFLELLNGAASLLIDGYRPLQLAQGAFFGVDEAGAVMHTVLPVGTGELRSKVGHTTTILNGVRQPTRGPDGWRA
jgi:hypothetical protein